MFLIPGTSHQITWSVQNLTDSTTYYVQAKIRDVRTESLLATVNLTNLGNGRFSGKWSVPQDPTNFGREVEIEKTVYTDSGYTTASETYGRWLDQYLIFNLGARSASTGGYGGGGDEHKKLIELIKAEMELIRQAIGASKSDPVDLSDVLSGLQGLLSGLSGVATRVSNIEDTGSASHDKIDGLTDSLGEVKKMIIDTVSSSVQSLGQEMKQSLANLSAEMLKNNNESRLDALTIEKKIDKELDSIVARFSQAMDIQGEKVGKHINETLKNPINVSLVGQTVPKEKPPNARQSAITKMLS